MPNVGPFELSVAILAAGRSRRMGRSKMLLPWEGTTIVGHLIATWNMLGARQVVVVRAADDEPMDAELDRLGFSKKDRIANSDPQRGMFSSVRCAAEWSGWEAATTHWAIALGDQPHLRRESLAQLVKFAKQNANRICQPGRGGHGLHPVVLPMAYFERLADAKAETLKDFLHLMADEVKLMETDDAGATLDIDLPEDYEKAREFGRGAIATRSRRCD
jgi:molybdenum cofactor cytidylyltransferase